MNRQHPFGTHHSHYQPRLGDGKFVSYEQAGRHLGHRAVAERCVVVVALGPFALTARSPRAELGGLAHGTLTEDAQTRTRRGRSSGFADDSAITTACPPARGAGLVRVRLF